MWSALVRARDRCGRSRLAVVRQAAAFVSRSASTASRVAGSTPSDARSPSARAVFHVCASGAAITAQRSGSPPRETSSAAPTPRPTSPVAPAASAARRRRTGAPASARRNAGMSRHRPAGSCASATISASVIRRGTPPGERSGVDIAAPSSVTVVPVNGRTPNSASHSDTANANTSARTSTAPPASCSGAMYAGVPIAAPVAVRRRSRVTVGDGDGDSTASAAHAMPKSVTSTRAARSAVTSTSTLSGLKSRWTMPAACAAASPSPARS